MDINEMTPRPEGQDNRSENGQSGKSKRPNRNHHRRGGRGRGHGGAQTPTGSAEHTAMAEAPTEVTAADAAPKPEGTPNGQKKQDRNRGRGRGDKRDRGDRAEKTDKAEKADRSPKAEADRPQESDRRRPATGRPQRTAHHAAAPDLPDMDDLLIEDGMTAAPVCVEEISDAEEIERILSHDPFAAQRETLPEVIPEGKVVIAGVRFRAGGKTYFFDPGDIVCTPGRYAVVETARGLEFGEICIGNRMLDESMVTPPLRPVVRLATEEDIAHNRENHEKEDEAFRIGVQKIQEHKLDMKLVTVQYTFDNAKLLFYFTSAKRVDFRELVKDLASIFHLRIELRQIGIRDEARMIGGLGPCGRPLCCNTFLSDFGQVSMKMAKEQNLSLNSTKISGCCGRLMCCLRYEHETYLEEIKRTPAAGTFVNTPDGPGVVTEVYLLQGEVKVSLRNQPDSAPKKYPRDAVTPIGRDRRTEPDKESPEPREDESEADDTLAED